ncbi:MAG: site-2 protease family protein [Nanoarchaeota archaeon]
MINLEKQVVNKKEGNKVLKFLKEMLICFIIGGFIGVILIVLEENPRFAYLLDKLPQIEVSFLTSLMLIAIASFININIHEFGHFVLGKILGYKLISYRFSIFSWNNENGKMKFSIRINKGYSGLCAMLPPDKKLHKGIEILFYAGGIFFNLIFALIFLFLGSLMSEYVIINNLFLFIALIGFILSVINLLPFDSGNSSTDGKIIWSLILKKPFANKLTDIKKISSQLAAGIRPGELSISFPDDMTNIRTYDLIFILYFYFKALDNNNENMMSAYAKILEDNIEVFPNHALPPLYYELCFQACISDDKEKAKEYYEKAGKILQKDQDVNGLRVKAYYEYYIKENFEKAFIYCEDALAVVDKFPIKGQAIMEERLVKELISKIDYNGS